MNKGVRITLGIVVIATLGVVSVFFIKKYKKKKEAETQGLDTKKNKLISLKRVK